MYKVTPVILKSESDIKEFRDRASKLINVDFPLEYFKQGLIRGFRNDKNQLVGGYALIKESPLRTVESLPDTFKIEFNVDEVMEVTSLWLDPSIKSGFPTCQFWYRFSRDVCSQKGKKSIIYAYDLDNKKLRKHYSNGNPTVVYRGLVKQLEGNSSENYESVELMSTKTIALIPLMRIHKFASRMLFRRKNIVKNSALLRRLPLSRVFVSSKL